MNDRDLIAEGRALLPAEGELLTSGQAFDLAEWAGLNLPALLDKLEQLQRGGKYLGDIVHRLQNIALDATGLHDLIDETGDGDWQAVWETVSDLGARNRELIADGQRRADAYWDKFAELSAERDAAIKERDEARGESERLANLYEQLQRDTREAFVRIAAKQQRDAARIAELESGLK